METIPTGSLAALVALGIWHGLNPGMGWLFAVALGLQEERGSAVRRALVPLALGHGVAIAAAVAAAGLLGMVIPLAALKWGVAVILVVFGIDRLVRGRHPRWVGMRVKPRELALWSFLMASAHGAGLMVVPFVLGTPAEGLHAAHGHAAHMATGASMLPGADAALWATGLHTAGYLLVTAVLALVVYRKLGLRLLRTHWFNLDLVWGGALVVTGLVTPFL